MMGKYNPREPSCKAGTPIAVDTGTLIKKGSDNTSKPLPSSLELVTARPKL